MRRVGLIAFLALVAMIPLSPPFYVTMGSYIGLYTMVALGLVLLTGVTGLTSFGQAAFMGLGAYTSAVLTTTLSWSPWLALVIALLLTIGVALVLGAVTLRMGGHYLPLATMSWGISLFFLFGSLPELGGQTGLSDIPALAIAGVELRDERIYYYLIWLVCLAAMWGTVNLLDSREGRAIRALKGGLHMAEAFGASGLRLKMVVFVYSAVLGCLAGWLYAHMQRFVNPSPFGINVGIEFLFMITIGGAGSIWGSVIGATLVSFLKTALQGILPKIIGHTGNFETIIFGIMILMVLQWMRGGIWVFVERFLPPKPNKDVGEASDLPVRTQPRRGEPLLRVDGIRKEFGGLVAVKNVSFEVAAGEIVGLIGPNGAGKSTTFNLISGELPRTDGNVYLGAEKISGLRPSRIARRGLSRTFQHVKLIPGMTVIENVMLGAYLRTNEGFFSAGFRLNRTMEKRVAAEAARQLKRVGLEESMHVPAGSLPLGKQRIVEIARALCSDPILLLLDEPAAGLRYKEKQELARLLEQLRSEGMTVLIVEHDMEFLMNLVDRIVVMEFGKKLAEGLPHEIRSNPEVLEAYLGGV
ncbi:ABC transporter permease subunit [Geomobilimonas luticola]|uniref:Branched-chain amino acid ABC transporter ATP-binding protein/permease n=1 Tax=Geomobilimonas luticola TaxID=1114878 RepID=A0ABS5SDK9_9BACT|nr:branched-chain amino acid ABC transporter ATP-binding protein/permease [Geomobilimonas luticola]MBT0653455.1 branched-chain amino acid ABC transporter ATP-binding protein/permease [Geomobilimonas luticola]